MKNEIHISLVHLEHIVRILKETESRHCTLTQENNNGYYSTDVEVFLKFNDIVGTFRVNIEDENNC